VEGKFYVTTPIYYVNDKPHIGHAYTTVLADVLARYHRMMGERVFFLTGTDEHGQKVADASTERGVEPRRHCDEMVQRFQDLWRRLAISNSDFIRTTQSRHIAVVQNVLTRLQRKGDIYLGTYDGWYCPYEERFWTEKDLVEGACPECGRATRRIAEQNYFFRMSRYQEWLVAYVSDNPSFVIPEARRNEVLGFLQKPLGDLCISRPRSRLAWGIPLPFDEDYVTYVWFDALLNYVSGVGHGGGEGDGSEWWPADLHLIGKDILTTHCVYWPTMLKASHLPMPRCVYAHGWWLTEEGKMSKSRGRVVDPLDLLERYGLDPFRYFLMREMTPGQDATFSEEALVRRLNSDLANDLGNLHSRVLRIVERHFDSRMPDLGATGEEENALRAQSLQAALDVKEAVEAVRVNAAVASTMELVGATNRYLERRAPWKLVRHSDTLAGAGTVLATACEVLRVVSSLLHPVMPFKCSTLRESLGLGDLEPSFQEARTWAAIGGGREIRSGGALFPRQP
jgi:methionyl-tRNA synthetase